MKTEIMPDMPEVEKEFGAGAIEMGGGTVSGDEATAVAGVGSSREVTAAGRTDLAGETAGNGSVTTEGSMENSAVAHGEGEIKTVMFENGHEGGSEETALKTASEGREMMFGGQGKASEDASGGSELSNEKKAGTSSAVSSSDVKKTRKGLVVGVVIGVLVLVAIGVGVWLMLGQGRQDTGRPDDESESSQGEEQEAGDGNSTELGDEAGYDDAIYGYMATCFESNDGTLQKKCNILELHTKKQNVVLASYELGKVNENGRREGGDASFLRFVDNQICYLNDYLFGEYTFQVYKALSCVDLSANEKKVVELLAVESDDYNTLDYMSVVTDKYVYYHSDRWGGTWLRYDIQTQELVDTGVDFDDTGALYYGSGVLVSGARENDELVFYGRDDDLNVITAGMTDSDLQQQYPTISEQIFDVQKSNFLYVGGKKMWIDEEAYDVYCDDDMIYDYPDDGNGVTYFWYDPSNQNAVFLVSNNCGGQTCDYRFVKYNVDSGKLVMKDGDLGYEYWTSQIIYLGNGE